MPNATKIERVSELKEQIEGANALLLTEYRGLTVSEITELRRSLREVEASLSVIKNTLMQRAANDAGIQDLDDLLAGPSAIAFVNGDDVVAVAKKLKDASKQFPSLVIKGGYMDGAALDADGARALADLESRDVMLAKIAGLIKAEMSRAAAAFVAAQSQFLALLEAYKQKVPPGEAEPAAPEAEASAPPNEPEAAEPQEASAGGEDAGPAAEDTTEQQDEPETNEPKDEPENEPENEEA
jgi:large subunit ribosomal protein L10